MEDTTVSCKIVAIGETGVGGKTSLIIRFINGSFDDNVCSTNGASYASKELKIKELNKNIILNIWDTAGQEKYRALTKFFYKDADAIILAYDITSKRSFLEIKDYWYPEIKNICNKNPSKIK